MEAAPINPSDFLFVRGMYGVRPAFPSSVGAEGVGRVIRIGSKVDLALQDKRVLIIPTYEQGTWADQVVAAVRNIVPMSDEADPLQLSMIGINPVTAYLLLNRYVSLMPGDWIGQTAANAAMGAVHHCAREARRSQDAECRPPGRSCRTGAAVGR
jgi:NADPH:quinone reductase-like Zn-dependent oxidoreductase